MDDTNVSPMAVHSGTMRLLLTLYLAFGLPLCCCHLSAAAACCAPAGQPDATVIPAADAHAHNGHHHDDAHQHQHGDEAPADEHAPDSTIPCDHDDSCKCGCDGSRSLLVEKSVAVDYPVLAVAAVRWISPITTVHRPSVRPLAIGATGPPTSLVRMHCALII